VSERSNIRKRSKVYRVFCSANARKRPARRRRAGRNRRQRRIKILRTMPKPRFSPKMKHDSCHYQYVGRMNGNKCPVRVLAFRQLERSASQAVSHATEQTLHLPSLRVRPGGRRHPGQATRDVCSRRDGERGEYQRCSEGGGK
jgi:hypothetical protein